MVRESGGQRPPAALLLSNVCSGTGQALVFGTEIKDIQEIYKKLPKIMSLCKF